MFVRVLAFLLGAGIAQAQTNSLFISNNVNTGVTWMAATDAGAGTSGSCTTTASAVQYYSAGFFTDQSASTYALHLVYDSLQSGFVYIYQNSFDPLDPCTGISVFGFAPITNIANIQLDANRQYFFVTSEDTLFGGGGSFHGSIDGPVGSHLFFGSPPGVQVPFCFGDGSGTACPCGNSSPAGGNDGCLSSIGSGGRLRTSGVASIASDSFVLAGSQMPNSSALYFQGTGDINGGAGSMFGDGLRCAGGMIVRLATKSNASGVSQFPESGDASVSATGHVTLPGTRTYQVWFRNAAAFCTPSTFNLTNGVRVDWIP